jgi:rhodanese-related sulfurtransferase
MNKEGYTSITEVLKKGLQSLSTAAFEVAANETGALVLDTRNPEHFVKGFIPNSINIGIDGSFAPWVGALIPDIQQNILLVCEPGREEEVVTRLARVGYDNVLGYLNGGFAAWKADGKEVDTIDSISAFEYAHRSTLQPLEVIDVRRKGEYDTQHVLNTKNAPLEQINENMAQFPAEKTFYLHCAGGYRSVIAASILKARGFNSIVNIEGGFDAINETEVPVSECVCSVN